MFSLLLRLALLFSCVLNDCSVRQGLEKYGHSLITGKRIPDTYVIKCLTILKSITQLMRGCVELFYYSGDLSTSACDTVIF